MKSYFRFLSRHRLFTVINIVGLCLSMAFLLLLGDLIYRQMTVENYQTRADRTFVVGNEMCMMSNFRVGERLKERFPEVEDWCSMAGYGMTFHIGAQKAETKVLVTGQNFFTFFDYRLLTGDRRKVLSAPNQIVVSKSFAQRYWPDESPIGKESAASPCTCSLLLSSSRPSLWSSPFPSPIGWPRWWAASRA